MKPGDIIEWRGLNKVHQGVVEMDSQGEFIVRMANGRTFSLNDLRYSKTAKLIQVWKAKQ